MISINGIPDHIHMLVGFRQSQSISDFILGCKRQFIQMDQWKTVYKKANLNGRKDMEHFHSANHKSKCYFVYRNQERHFNKKTLKEYNEF